MPYIRLGIIANTRQISMLPLVAVEDAFRHVDAILHAGDLRSAQMLDQLAGIAPVLAVRGDEDPDGNSLPLQRVLTFNQVRIGLTHGHRHPLVEEYFRFKRRIKGYGTGGAALLDSLLRRFPGMPVDAIIFGHPHVPFSGSYAGVRFFNPGAIYTDPAAYSTLEPPPPSSVGIIEISRDRHVSMQRIQLPVLALR